MQVKNAIYKQAGHVFPKTVYKNAGHRVFPESSLKRLPTIEELYNLDEAELKKLLGMRKMSKDDAWNMLGDDTFADDNVQGGENASPEKHTRVKEAKKTPEMKLGSKAISLKY